MSKLTDYSGSLTSLYIDWKDLLKNPKYIRKDNSITWDNRQGYTTPNFLRLRDVIDLIANQQYSFQIARDDSIIQMYYLFSDTGESLIKANLAYYGTIPWGTGTALPYTLSPQGALPIETIESIEIDEESEENDENIQEFDEGEMFWPSGDSFLKHVGWMRLDYNKDEQSTLIHPRAHLHLAGMADARIPFKGIPSPAQFVEFIISSYYPKDYIANRYDDKGSLVKQTGLSDTLGSHCIIDNSNVTSICVHFAVPE